jgi:hypothetical protein
VAPGRALRVEVVCSSSSVRLGDQDDPSSCDRENDSGGEGRLPEGGSFAWISAAACDQARETDVSERDKLTFSERDKLQREKRSEGNSRRPRNGRAQQRARWASGAYKRKVEERLFGKKEDAPRRRLEQRLREAHDTPNFLRIYREYTKSFGMPEAIDLLLLLLDLGEDREIVRVLNGTSRCRRRRTPLPMRPQISWVSSEVRFSRSRRTGTGSGIAVRSGRRMPAAPRNENETRIGLSPCFTWE